LRKGLARAAWQAALAANEWPEAKVSDEELSKLVVWDSPRALCEALDELQEYRALKSRETPSKPLAHLTAAEVTSNDHANNSPVQTGKRKADPEPTNQTTRNAQA